ncbi:hypothetical protein FO519_002639 [Halicephalobus sp. NKZ332]|nr:hypothetical protein FO519_002639 [Halicephalobus sp. NKZ332]
MDFDETELQSLFIRAANERRSHSPQNLQEDSNEVNPTLVTKNKNCGTQLHYTAPKLLERITQFEASSASFQDCDQRLVYVNILNDKKTTESTSEYWQDRHFTQAGKLGFLYENQVNSDITFNVSGTILTAHKFVLSICSAVFEAMFSGNWATEKVVEVPDIDPDVFREMLKFAYTDSVSLNSEIVMQVLYAARKYQIRTLEYLCIEYLGGNLVPQNALVLLDQARKFEIPFLEELCLQLIDQSTTDVVESESFTNVSKETLLLIVVRDSLKINELVLFNAIIKWGTSEAARGELEPTSENLKTILSDVIKHIRFPLMNQEEFAKNVVPSKLLDDAEVVEVFCYFTMKKEKPLIRFDSHPRAIKNTEDFIINRFQRIESRWGYNGTPDRVKFQVDYPVLLKGFGLYGSMNEIFTYKVTLEVSKSCSGTVVAKNETDFVSNGKSETFRVYFDEPVEIQPNIQYIASVTLIGQDSYYGSKGLRQIIQQTSTRPITVRFAYSAGNNNGTSVDDGQIPEFIFSVCT